MLFRSLGYLAGEMMITDPATVQQFGAQSHTVAIAAGLVGATLVVTLGKLMQRRKGRTASA